MNDLCLSIYFSMLYLNILCQVLSRQMQLARCCHLATVLGRATQSDIRDQSAHKTMHHPHLIHHYCCHTVPVVSRAARQTLTTVILSKCIESMVIKAFTYL